MRKTLLLLVCGIISLSVPGAFAQSSPASKTVTDDNYVLTLSAVGKEGDGLALIVTSSQTFNTSRANFTFSGTLTQLETGPFRLDYLLETHSVNDGTIHTGSSVILHPGEPVQIIKNGEQYYNLRLDRYNAATPTKAGG